MEGPRDDLKWFGEGFDGFPKRLPDDCVEYILLVIDSNLKSKKEILTRLELIRKEAQKISSNLLKNYIWQRDGFKLESNSDKGLIYLHGLTNYGDSVEDEWLVVYILRELSAQYPDLWIRVGDTDGEFLLIEAANALPRWLNPEIAENRVWIHQSSLHVIPLETGSRGSLPRNLDLHAAHDILRSSPTTLLHSLPLEEEAFYRLRNYPSQITDSLHYSQLRIPRKLAYILHELPTSIAPAVESFYLRDPIAIKALQKSQDALCFPPNDFVQVSVRFTKVLFAQVRSQQFPPPENWKKIVSEATHQSSAVVTGHSDHSRLDLGMKITCGFEMLVNDPAYQDNRAVREINLLLDDIATENVTLPSDEEIFSWEGQSRDDDEKWLDINFEDFEKELQGKRQESDPTLGPKVFGPEPPTGFGDANTKADLQKMVERFEKFMKDEDAGEDGADVDEMDIDDDGDDESGDSEDDSSDDENQDIKFDNDEFARMMREMMGLPAERLETSSGIRGQSDSLKDQEPRKDQSSEDVSEEEDRNEGEEIRKVMQMMEKELTEVGALNLEGMPNQSAHNQALALEKPTTDSDVESGSDDEVDIDLNLAKNLLESFKSQAGMAGPGGNLMGMLGVSMPRDEDDELPAKKQ
ncbi:hypothetical protein BP5796_07276 [Coleophoma crateriformis]|uniref:SGT1-domain-containing protein n=1 Tax=Coleophoma crateriformis TaxID=565419 RepID=A0A3D8RIW6_9HELO|nr:hypothetical protein BP5796_07276 [Coleophoma crateriformis]